MFCKMNVLNNFKMRSSSILLSFIYLSMSKRFLLTFIPSVSGFAVNNDFIRRQNVIHSSSSSLHLFPDINFNIFETSKKRKRNKINNNNNSMISNPNQNSTERDVKNDEWYQQALMQAARDPKSFELFIMEQEKRKKGEQHSEGMTTVTSSTTTTVTSTKTQTFTSDSSRSEETKNVKKSSYIRIEEWDEKRTRDDLSYDEKVQFDSQRFGNQFAQNEILRKNLKSF